jgi:CRISPR/Cas system-associated exonuclease Cas4 (RecB family)
MTSENKEFITVSPSVVGYLFECPRCLWLHYNESIKRPRGAFPSLPDGMDDIFKKYFDIYRLKGILPPELESKVKGKLYDNIEKLNIWRDINFGKGGLSAEFPEYNIRLRGAIDELIISEDGKYIPLDFKTRGYPTKEDSHEHYRYQLDCYALLFEENNMPPADIGYLLFFWPERYEDHSVYFRSELVKLEVNSQRARALLAEIRKVLDGPIPPSHEACEYCLYREPR